MINIEEENLARYVLSYKNMSGIYKITNIINGKFYIGSSVNLYLRWYSHKTKLLNNNHGNKYLQSSFNKHGLDKFDFEVIEVVHDKELLIKREQYWIDSLDATNKSIAYNLSPIAGSRLGSRHSEDTKAKISRNRKGIKIPDEAMARSAKNRTGLKKSEETKRKISESHKGLKHSEEAKRKISRAQLGQKRGPRSEDVKEKISKANKGRTTMPKGEDMYNALLTNEQVKEIKFKMLDGEKNAKLAKEYDVHPSIISQIRAGSIYKNVSSDIDLSHTCEKRLSEAEVVEIKRLLLKDIDIKDISTMYNRAPRVIKDIKNGKTWANIIV